MTREDITIAGDAKMWALLERVIAAKAARGSWIEGPVLDAIELAEEAMATVVPPRHLDEAGIAHPSVPRAAAWIRGLAERPQEIRHHAGELTADEMRVVRAVLRFVAWKIEEL